MNISKLQTLKLLSRIIYQFMPRSVSHTTWAIAGYEKFCSLTVISLISHEGEHLSPSASCHLLMETSQPLTQGQGHTGWWEGDTLASSSPPSWGTARERESTVLQPPPPPRPGLTVCAVTGDLELKGRAISPLYHLDRCPGLSNSSPGALELECFSCQVWQTQGRGRR